MISIAEVIKNIVEADQDVFPAYRLGVVNYSSYARVIQKEVEARTHKEVQVRSIIVALSRLAKKYAARDAVARNIPNINLKNLSIHTDIGELSYERSRGMSKQILEAYRKVPRNIETYFTVTQGVGQITIVGERNLLDIFKKELGDGDVVFERYNLTAITIAFPRSYLEEPNVINALTHRLSAKGISLVEIVSTLTELTFVVKQKDTQAAVSQLTKEYSVS